MIMYVSASHIYADDYRMLPKEFFEIMANPWKYIDGAYELPDTPLYSQHGICIDFPSFFELRYRINYSISHQDINDAIMTLIGMTILFSSGGNGRELSKIIRYCDEHGHQIQFYREGLIKPIGNKKGI